ncbi:uncharacterized protein LOC121636944 [Melanotaenia boesemani]|uniref:uncharacterized protein LOC121636944 n=1 Tax=Melanotaenia boesemani TaxID=1250792 RepID=UPI001C04F340|nr:uncharacterized protein LOC121636944 [Melanotaenia boesemani]
MNPPQSLDRILQPPGSWWGGWSLSQQLPDKRQGPPWTGHQSIAGPTHRDYNHPRSLRSQSSWREASQARAQHAHSTQKGSSRASNQEPSCWEAAVLTPTPPCSPSSNSTFNLHLLLLPSTSRNIQPHLLLQSPPPSPAEGGVDDRKLHADFRKFISDRADDGQVHAESTEEHFLRAHHEEGAESDVFLKRPSWTSQTSRSGSTSRRAIPPQLCIPLFLLLFLHLHNQDRHPHPSSDWERSFTRTSSLDLKLKLL